MGPVLEAMEDILAALLRSLDGRVYVAVGRGLWDFTSKDIYDYVDSLQEGKENKVCSSPNFKNRQLLLKQHMISASAALSCCCICQAWPMLMLVPFLDAPLSLGMASGGCHCVK